MPVQSETIPLINIYFTLCISFSLASMVWFSIINLLRDAKPLPNCIRCFVLKFLCCLISNQVTTNCQNNNKDGIKILIFITFIYTQYEKNFHFYSFTAFFLIRLFIQIFNQFLSYIQLVGFCNG